MQANEQLHATAETLRRVFASYGLLLRGASELEDCLPELYGDHVRDGKITLTLPVGVVDMLLDGVAAAGGMKR